MFNFTKFREYLNINVQKTGQHRAWTATDNYPNVFKSEYNNYNNLFIIIAKVSFINNY